MRELAEEKPSPTYRLQFRVQESGAVAKTATNKRYALIVQSGSRGKINASRRIPYYTSSEGDAQEVHTAALGSIIECTPTEVETGVRLECAFESSFVEPGQAAKPIPSGFLPVVDARQVSTTTTTAIGQEVQLASLDDPVSGNRLEVLVTIDRVRSPGGAH